MGRKQTYGPEKLLLLKGRIEQLNLKYNTLGYGSRTCAARWMIDNKHHNGNIDFVAKKLAHILHGYVRGIHPKLRDGGVWSAEEAERCIDLLENWYNNHRDEMQEHPCPRNI